MCIPFLPTRPYVEFYLYSQSLFYVYSIFTYTSLRRVLSILTVYFMCIPFLPTHPYVEFYLYSQSILCVFHFYLHVPTSSLIYTHSLFYVNSIFVYTPLRRFIYTSIYFMCIPILPTPPYVEFYLYFNVFYV